MIPGRRSGRIVGQSLGLRRCLERLERLAPSDLPVLIQGETGTGKELAARRLHRKSLRRRGRLAPRENHSASSIRETVPEPLSSAPLWILPAADGPPVLPKSPRPTWS